MGGAAFARHGLNTHVPKAHDFADPFDVEGYVSRQKFVDLSTRMWGSAKRQLGYRVIFEGRQYPVDAMFFPEDHNDQVAHLVNIQWTLCFSLKC